MGLGKSVVIFFAVSLFALTVIGMGAIAFSDKPTDDYYTNESNSVSGTTELAGVGFSGAGSVMIPAVGIAAILVLLAGFLVLKRK